MRIGIPKEIKLLEGRVALIPAAAGELAAQGHDIYIEAGAGLASGYSDLEYQNAGVTVLDDAASVYGDSELVVKVKEPVAPETELLRADHLLFSFLHLAAEPKLARKLCDIGLTAVAFETVEEHGRLPLLAPMSDIAGRLAVHIGTTLLHQHNGGRGVLLGGLPAGERGHVVVLGAGAAGGSAVTVAAALGARVTVFARSRQSLSRMHAIGANVTALPSYGALLDAAVADADLLVGAVLVPGAAAPMLVTEAMVKTMRAGAVIVDIAVDQGGCVETTEATTYASPTLVKHGVVHFGVTNMPGAVPRTASQALSAALLPFVARLAAADGLTDPALASGINIHNGEIVHSAVKKALQ